MMGAQYSVATDLGSSTADSYNYGAAIAFALMGLCAIAFTITRANAVRRTFATSRRMVESQLDVMRRIAQTQSARAAAFVAVCTIALLGIVTLQIDLEERVVLAVTPMMLLVIGVLSLFRLERLQTLRGDLRVTTHGHYMFVARGKRLVGWVAAPPALLAQATALPIAKLQR